MDNAMDSGLLSGLLLLLDFRQRGEKRRLVVERKTRRKKKEEEDRGDIKGKVNSHGRSQREWAGLEAKAAREQRDLGRRRSFGMRRLRMRLLRWKGKRWWR